MRIKPKTKMKRKFSGKVSKIMATERKELGYITDDQDTLPLWMRQGKKIHIQDFLEGKLLHRK